MGTVTYLSQYCEMKAVAAECKIINLMAAHSKLVDDGKGAFAQKVMDEARDTHEEAKKFRKLANRYAGNKGNLIYSTTYQLPYLNYPEWN